MRAFWFFKKHDVIYKKLTDGQPKVIVAKRLYCSNINGCRGCGKTTRLQLNVSIYHLWYALKAVWLFFYLHYINKKCITASYESATATKNPRNAYRWLTKLKLALPIIKNKMPPPTNPLQIANNISFSLLYIMSCFQDHACMPAAFQYAFQSHFLNQYLTT